MRGDCEEAGVAASVGGSESDLARGTSGSEFLVPAAVPAWSPVLSANSVPILDRFQVFGSYSMSRASVYGRLSRTSDSGGAQNSFDWVQPPSISQSGDAKSRNSKQQHSAGASGGEEEPLPSGNKRNAYRRYRKIFGRTLAVLVVVSVLQEVLKTVIFARQGCLWLDHSDSAACGLAARNDAGAAFVWVYIIRLPALFKQVLGILFAVAAFAVFLLRLREFRKAMRLSQQEGGARELSHDQRVLLQGHWTPAASSDVYRETSRLLVDGQILALLLIGTTVASVTITHAQYSAELYTIEDLNTWRVAACCPPGEAWGSPSCSWLCMMGTGGFSTTLTITFGLASIMAASVMFIPPQLWSHITFSAATKTNDIHMHRLLRLPLPLMMFVITNLLLFVVYGCRVFLEEQMAHRVVWEIVFVVVALLFVCEVGVLAWVLPWRRMLQTPSALYSHVAASLTAAGSQASAVHSQQPPRPSLWRCRECSSYRQLVLLFGAVLAFCVDALETNGMITPSFWVIRGTCLLLLVFCFDEPVDHSILHSSGAAFGLVVNAKHLRDALQAHLNGTQYTGKVARYKASLLRMCETMAISYRWQPQVVAVGAEGMELNMTDWQIRQVVAAIDRTKCLYVWLDGFSVPQQDRALKDILLARMMAVYGSAFVTLVLLSKEKENDRYHQRMWTLQEYCASKQLLIAREEEVGTVKQSSSLQAREVAKGLEGVHAESQRHEHVRMQGHTLPVWLGSDVATTVRSIPTADAQRIWQAYRVLSNSRHCLLKADSVRALYPLLWNRPSESEEELKALIQAVQDVHAIPQQEVLMRLRQFTMLAPKRVSRKGISTIAISRETDDQL